MPALSRLLGIDASPLQKLNSSPMTFFHSFEQHVLGILSDLQYLLIGIGGAVVDSAVNDHSLSEGLAHVIDIDMDHLLDDLNEHVHAEFAPVSNFTVTSPLATESTIQWIFTVFWVYPLYCVSFGVNLISYQEIAVCAFLVHGDRPEMPKPTLERWQVIPPYLYISSCKRWQLYINASMHTR